MRNNLARRSQVGAEKALIGKHSFTLRLSQHTLQRIDELAAGEKRKRTNMCEVLVEEALRTREANSRESVAREPVVS